MINNVEFCYERINEVDFKLLKNKKFILEGDLSISTDERGIVVSKEKIEQNYTKEQVLEILKEVLNKFENKLDNLSEAIPENFIKLDISVDNLINTEEIKTNEKLNILVSSICFINRNKPGAEIYATFANRLLNDVMTKTPYDFRVITNEPSHFYESQNKWGKRIIITEDNLVNERLTVGPFNQLLKYKTMLGVDKKYDWLLYLDCDAGFTGELDSNAIDQQTKVWESQGYDFLAARTNAVLRYELQDHEEKQKKFYELNPDNKFNPWTHGGNLFSAKFIFYNVTSENGPHEWMDAKLPSEHVWYIKNDNKMEKLGKQFKKFNEKFETQTPENLITWDMEAFEVGVSALISGYNMGDLGNDGQFHIFKIGFNLNNWEKVKY
jgi:hypothetical protein